MKKPIQLSNDKIMKSFPCNQCGWCCQNLQNHKLYKSLDRGDGVCIYFNATSNSCTIYNNRPLICNIEAMYYAEFSNMSYDDYIKLNIKACQSAQIENNLPIIQIQIIKESNMPIPILLGGISLAIAGIGVATGAKGVSDLSDASDIVKDSQQKLEIKREYLNKLRIDTNDELRNLGQLKVDIFSTQIKHFIDVIRKNGAFHSKLENFSQTLTKQEYLEMKQAVTTAIKIENGIADGVTAGTLTGMGAYGTVSLFGAASTGTAISTLAGAASTNATLAWLGGGSLATGGLGMAGGTMIIGGLVAGPLLAITGFHLAGKGEEALTQARAVEARNDLNIAEIELMKVAVKAININALEVQKILLETVKRFEIVKVDDVSDEKAFTMMFDIAKSLKEMLNQPILNSNGEAINNIRHKCEGYLQI